MKASGIIVNIPFENKDIKKIREKIAIPIVATVASPGHDIGIVSLTGELVRVQMKKNGANPSEAGRKIFRKARPNDIERWQAALYLLTKVTALVLLHSLALTIAPSFDWSIPFATGETCRL